MYLINRISTIIGMRLHTIPKDFREEARRGLLCQLETEVERAISEGQVVFQCGMSMGADIWVAGAILALKSRFPQIQLHCYLPCETQANYWPEQWREPYFEILARADEVFCLQYRYSRDAVYRRNREMVGKSSRLIVLYDKKIDGGMQRAIEYAKVKDLEIRTIHTPGPETALPEEGGRILALEDYMSSQISSVSPEGSEMGRSAIRRASL